MRHTLTYMAGAAVCCVLAILIGFALTFNIDPKPKPPVYGDHYHTEIDALQSTLDDLVHEVQLLAELLEGYGHAD